jgi:uncharacterized protein with PQ loop repeat
MKANLLGLVSVILVQSATIPQTVAMFRTGDLSGVAVEMFWILWVGLLGFVGHSIATKNRFYLFSNLVGLLNSTAALVAYYGSF